MAPSTDFWLLAAMLSGFGGVGVWEGYEIHPVLFSQSAVIFGFIAYFGYRVFYLERKDSQSRITEQSTNFEDSHSL